MLSVSAKDKYFFFKLGLVKVGFCLLLEWLPCSSVKRFQITFQMTTLSVSYLSKFHGENQTVLQTHCLSNAQ